MLRQQHRFFRNVLMACDLAIIIAAAVLAYFLRFHALSDIIPPKESVTSFQVHAIPIMVVWPLMWLAAIGVGLYKPRRDQRFYREAATIVKAVLLGLGLTIAQDLVSRNGGLIEFSSRPGATSFQILLPVSNAPEAT